MTDAHGLLRRLVGKTLPTMTGLPNQVLAVGSHNVLVGTTKSPDGRWIPIASVQAALDRLERVRSIEISAASVGYRSPFIGAVLITLPGATFELKPRRIRLPDRRTKARSR